MPLKTPRFWILTPHSLSISLFCFLFLLLLRLIFTSFTARKKWIMIGVYSVFMAVSLCSLSFFERQITHTIQPKKLLSAAPPKILAKKYGPQESIQVEPKNAKKTEDNKPKPEVNKAAIQAETESKLKPNLLIVRTAKELQTKINEALADTTIHVEGRVKITDSICIKQKNGLHLTGLNDNAAIYTEDGEIEVLSITDSSNITIEKLKLYHETPPPL